MVDLMTPSPRMDGSPSLPVIMMDGDERVHVGSVSFHPSQSVKKLQLSISQQIGLAPYQISSFLARDRYFRIPIGEKTDLSVVSREAGEWHVLAVVRRQRNGRNRRGGKRMPGGSTGFARENPDPKSQQEKIILRRNGSGQSHLHPVQHLMRGPAEMGVNTGGNFNLVSVWDQYYQTQIRNLQRERERYSMEMMGQDTWRAEEASGPVCGVCEEAADLGEQAGFHRCVRDEVVEVGPFFKSPVGPIERPSRRNFLID